MGCLCFAMVIGFGSIAGCPKGTPKTSTKPGGGTEVTVTPSTKTTSTKTTIVDKDWVKVMDASVEVEKGDGKTAKVTIKIERGDGDKIKDKDVDVTFTVPKDKGIKDIEKVTIAKDKKEVEITVTTTKGAEFTADVDIVVEAKAGDIKGSGKLTAKVKK